ncbi:MAG TPA: NAD(P)/FAD-dependent oxidoreductase, partial [Candidatus Agrococcus pullicola]|nr:NAD(P)/FAD-dependent oxidoreductase [Candidatus Agrococcus pullicola]
MNAEHGDQIRDVAIVGGGAAGLSAALTLARARRSAIVIDGGHPRNAPAAAAHGLIGLEGINPLELLETARNEARSYGAEIVQTAIADASGSRGSGFVLQLDDGSAVRARQVLIATGVRDEMPAVLGLAERWGRDVVHCPYCHGWEIRDTRIGLLVTGPMSAMQAMLFHQWSGKMSFFSNGHEFPADQLGKLSALGIEIVPGAVSAVEVVDDRLA